MSVRLPVDLSLEAHSSINIRPLTKYRVANLKLIAYKNILWIFKELSHVPIIYWGWQIRKYSILRSYKLKRFSRLKNLYPSSSKYWETSPLPFLSNTLFFFIHMVFYIVGAIFTPTMGCKILCLFNIPHIEFVWMGFVKYDLVHNVKTVFGLNIC